MSCRSSSISFQSSCSLSSFLHLLFFSSSSYFPLSLSLSLSLPFSPSHFLISISFSWTSSLVRSSPCLSPFLFFLYIFLFSSIHPPGDGEQRSEWGWVLQTSPPPSLLPLCTGGGSLWSRRRSRQRTSGGRQISGVYGQQYLVVVVEWILLFYITTSAFLWQKSFTKTSTLLQIKPGSRKTWHEPTL